MPHIKFYDGGFCSYCHLHEELDRQYPNKGEKGRSSFQNLIETIRSSGKGKPFDYVIGVSGGCDSTYLLHTLVKEGLRPLAVHFDNTWNSPIATQNIHKAVSKRGIKLSTYVVNSREYDDIYRAFMLSGVPDIEAPTDIGFISALYMAAERTGIKFVVEGHSFRTEGVSPLGYHYMDGKYIKTLHEKIGRYPQKTFPNMTLWRFLRWSGLRNFKRVRPLYYMDNNKDEAKKFLAKTYDWEWYGGHHLENRFTAFYHSYFMPTRFGVDNRVNGYAGHVRSGFMNRDEALEALTEAPYIEDDILQLVKKRLDFSDEKFEAVMNLPKKT